MDVHNGRRNPFRRGLLACGPSGKRPRGGIARRVIRRLFQCEQVAEEWRRKAVDRILATLRVKMRAG